MRHERFESGTDTGTLRLSERRVVEMLRFWQADRQGEALDRLCRRLGSVRAGFCIRAFSEVMELVRRHAWHAPLILPVGATSHSDDELAIARLILTATEQHRDSALAEAAMLVSPMALVPLVAAAERTGLPLLCEECRGRLCGAAISGIRAS